MSRHQIVTYIALGLILVLQIANIVFTRRPQPVPNYVLPTTAPAPTPVSQLPSPNSFQDELAQIRAELRAINQVLGISKSTPDISNILDYATPSAFDTR